MLVLNAIDMNKIFIKLAIFLAVVAVIGGGGYYAYKSFRYVKEDVPQAVSSKSLARETTRAATPDATPDAEPAKVVVIGAAQVVKDAKTATGQTGAGKAEQTGADFAEQPISGSTEQTSAPEPVLPEELNLEMVFYSQAPFGNWDFPWQEACEEATVLLISNEYQSKNWTREQFNDEILKLVEWEKKTFGDYKHTTIKETAKILNDYLGLKTLVFENPTYNDIKKILNRGHFVVMTFDGKKLGNPFYKNGGPVYHAMVIKGYKKDYKVITSDVGTRNGENYVYKWETIENAMHDYAVPMSDGAKRIIEVIPPSL